jgi:small subunit ribosomal protein S16
LRRVGRKKQPEYRIVVAERTKARDGRIVETLGHYNPRTKPETITVDADKARVWLGKGATPSETVRSLFKKAGVFSPPAEA